MVNFTKLHIIEKSGYIYPYSLDEVDFIEYGIYQYVEHVDAPVIKIHLDNGYTDIFEAEYHTIAFS